ncbi:hypothetical protein [Parasphingorhabdus sp.]|uniref:hypothetical protein n=1 Tax=Parasphingorhabdus sp. TaxID=2709688 RepID=UPI003265BBCE
MVKIKTREQFEKWLEDKPAGWAQALALRSALRVLPIALNSDMFAKNGPPPGLTAAMIRAMIISWAARSCPAHDMAAYAANAAANAAYAAKAATNAAANAAYAANAATNAAYAANAVFWKQLVADCDILLTVPGADAEAQGRTLLRQPLWGAKQMPKTVHNSWRNAVSYLDGEGLHIWRRWYQRRLAGDASGFSLPLEQDLIVQARLLKQTKSWWTGGKERSDMAQFQKVSQEIEGWVADFQPEKLPSEVPDQNSYAITFRPGDDGPITIEGSIGADRLLADQDALDRYNEVKAETENIIEACSRTNAGGSLKRRALGYLDALGGDINSIQPSLVVQRGQTLRDKLAEQLNPNPDPMTMPLSGDLLLDLKAWQSAHNMMVLMDPELEKRDKALYGPDQITVVIALEKIKQVVIEANSQNVIDQSAQDALVDATGSAESEIEEWGRLYRLASESLKNLVKAIVQWCWKHKGKISAATSGSLYAGAAWIQRNAKWLLEVFADNPNMIEWIQYISKLPL